MLQKRSFYFHSNCQKTLWNLIKCFLRFDILDNTRKFVQRLLFTGQFAFSFRILCFQQPVMCYRNYLSTSQVNARIPVPPHNFSPDVFFIRQNYKKNRPLSFLHWRACIFLLEFLCFQQHFRSWRKNLIFCKMIVKTTCRLSKVVAWCLS